MNRKLHNTILAFSVTGLVLAVGLMSARPLSHDRLVPGPTIIVHAPPAAAPQDLAAEAAADAMADALTARIEARSRRFEAEMAQAASFGHALSATTEFVTAVTTDAALSGALDKAVPKKAKAQEEAAPPAPQHRRRGGSVRSTIAVPYFSFARGMGRGDRS